MKMVPTESHICMFSPQLMNYLRRTRKYGLTESGGLSLWGGWALRF